MGIQHPAVPADEPAVVERGTGATGGELVLRRAGEHFEIISNGVFLMDTRDGASERAMVRDALAAVPAGRTGVSVLIGGLGVGFSARAALDDPRVGRVHALELEPRIVAWHSTHLAPVAGNLTADPRFSVTQDDLLAWLERAEETFDAICLDVDNGPGWTVTEGNARLYEPAALRQVWRLTRPGGAVTFWSATRAPGFADVLEEVFGEPVEERQIAARRGEPDVVYLARRANTLEDAAG
ncbi:spermidine synthase family protein [Salinactinospora qingdaonensis]|uniref:Spermidine synthase n=1 Tax=Salinactinospora qingdaonensis TaxID=702744 RepID=A0ABP7F401_9ACTN